MQGRRPPSGLPPGSPPLEPAWSARCQRRIAPTSQKKKKRKGVVYVLCHARGNDTLSVPSVSQPDDTLSECGDPSSLPRASYSSYQTKAARISAARAPGRKIREQSETQGLRNTPGYHTRPNYRATHTHGCRQANTERIKAECHIPRATRASSADVVIFPRINWVQKERFKQKHAQQFSHLSNKCDCRQTQNTHRANTKHTRSTHRANTKHTRSTHTKHTHTKHTHTKEIRSPSPPIITTAVHISCHSTCPTHCQAENQGVVAKRGGDEIGHPGHKPIAKVLQRQARPCVRLPGN